MLERNRDIQKKFTVFSRVVSLLLPVVCIVLMLTQVAFAKTTYVINDGGYVVVHTTYATDPADVLNEAGLELGKDDTYTTQNSIGVSEITIQRKQVVQIVYGKNTLSVISYGETVEELLARMSIELGEDDVVSVALNTVTYDGMCITVSQSATVEEIYSVAVPYTTEYCYDSSLTQGQQVVLTEGCEGQVQYVDTVCYVDGQEISRTTISTTVLSQPVNELIAIGTEVDLPDYPEETEPETTPEPEAECVTVTDTPSISDGVIVTPDGEVLTYTSSIQVVATAYHSTDAGCDTTTATGTQVRVGTVAVDPSMIPYGTRMYIVTNDGEYIYGIAVAEDCGGAIKGNRIDLYFNTVAECWTFGVREATIYFLG